MTVTDQTPAPLDAAERIRARRLADARALLDLIEANPALPFTGIHISEFPAGDDDQERAAVDAAAAILGASPVPGARGHYRVERRIGASEYQVTAIPQATMRRVASANVAYVREMTA